MPVYVYVSYPRKRGAVFDLDYYVNTHMSIVDKHWAAYGLQSWTVVQFEEGDPSGLHVQAIMLWESKGDFERALAADIPEVMNDLKNYSSEPPVRYFAEVLKRG